MGNAAWRILMVDDDRDEHFMVREMLAVSRQDKFLLECVDSYAKGREALQNNPYDAVLVDYDLGGYSGINLIQEAQQVGCQAPILLLTGRGNYEVDLEAMQAGAADYLNKQDLNAALLERSIRFAMERSRLLKENHRQRDLLERIMGDSLMAIAVLQGPQHRYILSNPAFDALARKGNLIGRTVAEVWPEIADQVVPLLDQVYQTGQPFTAVDRPFQVIRDQGLETVYCSFAYAPLHNSEGQVEGIVITVDETTQQVADRQAVVEWQETLRSFFEVDSMIAGILELHEDDMMYVRANKKLAACFGLSPDQIIGKSGRDVGFDEETRI